MNSAKSFAVLGLGPSLKNYKGKEDYSIGVNDIWQHHKTDYVVCVDTMDRFKDERLQAILNCKPEAFYTFSTDWERVHGFTLMKAQSPRGTVDFQKEGMAYSIFSPFAAMFMELTS